MYSLQLRKEVVELFKQGFTTKQVFNRLEGKVDLRTLRRWKQHSAKIKAQPIKPKRKRRNQKRKPPVHLTDSQRSELRRRVASGDLSFEQAAVVYDISLTTVHNICRIVKPRILKAYEVMDDEIKAAKDNLPDDVDTLKAMVQDLQFETLLLKEVVEILKKDHSVDYLALTNKEKAMIIDAMKANFSISYLTKKLAISPSSYYYASASNNRQDKYLKARKALVEEFERAKRSRGYRYLYQHLKQRQDVVSINEKLVRRFMKEEGLVVVYHKKKRRYSSYKGEISEAPKNLVKRKFKASRPNQIWITDITEFRLPNTDTKVYLSPVIDCFDGKVIAWSTDTSPTAQFACNALEAACKTLKPQERPIIHSDKAFTIEVRSGLGCVVTTT